MKKTDISISVCFICIFLVFLIKLFILYRVWNYSFNALQTKFKILLRYTFLEYTPSVRRWQKKFLIFCINLSQKKLTVHLCGFSPVCRRICTTNIYCALNGFSPREQFSHRHIKAFLFVWIWSLFICLTSSSWVTNSIPHPYQWQFVSIKSPGSSFISVVSAFVQSYSFSGVDAETHLTKSSERLLKFLSPFVLLSVTLFWRFSKFDDALSASTWAIVPDVEDGCSCDLPWGCECFLNPSSRCFKIIKKKYKFKKIEN